jgi:hypothetical protein
MSRRTLPVLGAVVLAAGLIALTQLTGRAGDGDVKLVIPAAAATGLIADDILIVNKALEPKDGKVLPKDVKRAKVATLDIALTAKATKNDALYAQAVQVLEALDKEDGVADARKAAEGLSKPAGGDAKGDPIKLALWDKDNKSWDKDMAMQLFKTARAGGLGYEKTIKDFAEKDPPAGKLKEIATLAYKTAMLAQAIEQLNPEKPEWKKFAQNLQASAVEVGAAATKKNAAAVKTALGKMDGACVNCHDKFKKE